MGKKEKRPDLNRVLIDEAKSISPFASIVLKEKKEKKQQVRLERKKPEEIVKGYIPSLSFGDILSSYEKTGNPYSLPKKKASSPQDFGSILESWDNSQKKDKRVKANDSPNKSQYKATKSFASILSQYEDQTREKELPKGEKKKPTKSVNELLRSGSLELEKRDSEDTSSEEKKEIKKNNSSTSKAYKASTSFANILSQYESGLKKEKKSVLKENEVAKNDEDSKEKGSSLLLERNSLNEVPNNVSWSIIGGKNEAFVREEEKKEEKKEKKERAINHSPKYEPKEDFGSILSSFDKEKARKKSQEEESKTSSKDKPVLPDDSSRFFIKDETEKVPDSVSWSILGGKNSRYERKNEESRIVEENKEQGGSKPYSPEKSFSTLLSSFEERESVKTFSEILKEKGDLSVKKTTLSINELRRMDPQATLDLHGESQKDGEQLILSFLEDSYLNNLRKISIITGKGLHSESGSGVLRELTERILSLSPYVTESSSAPLSRGGSGAIWVILKEKKEEKNE